jgi:hypothetical protein
MKNRKKTKNMKNSGWLRSTPRNPSRPMRPQYQLVFIFIVRNRFPIMELSKQSSFDCLSVFKVPSIYNSSNAFSFDL